jgi:hypothetical protein
VEEVNENIPKTALESCMLSATFPSKETVGAAAKTPAAIAGDHATGELPGKIIWAA